MMFPNAPQPLTKSYENKWWILFAVGLGVFMSTLDMSIINVSLPTMVTELHTHFATIQWVILSYALVITSAMLGVARLGDMFGKKKLYSAGLGLFTLSSLLCGFSPSVHWLIAFRGIQGIGAVMTQALGTAIVTEAVPPQERGKAFGIIGSTVSIGLVLGPPLGGLIIGWAGWPWIFFVNVPIGMLAVAATIRFVPNLPPARSGQKFDFSGSITFFAALACYALGMTYGQAKGFEESGVLALLAGACVWFAVFLFSMRRSSEPMLDPTLFRNVLFSINLTMGFLLFVVLAGLFLMPFYLHLVQGYNPRQIGLLMIVGPAWMGLIAPFSGSLSDRFGSRIVSIIGLVVVAFGCYAITTLTAHTDAIGYILRMTPLGIGLGLFSSPNMNAIMSAVPRHRLGIASGLTALSRTLGQTTGVPLMGAIFVFFALSGEGGGSLDQLTSAGPEQLMRGLHYTFGLAEVGIILSAILAVAAMLIDRRRTGQNSTM